MSRRSFESKVVAGRRRFLRQGLTGLGALVGAPILARCGGTGGGPLDLSIDMPIDMPIDMRPPDMGGPNDLGPGDMGGPRSNFDAIGPIGSPDVNGIRLPAGFTSRIIARSGQMVGTTGYTWHDAPDGGHVFPTSGGGWIYVSNSEITLGGGGASAVRFSSSGAIADAYSILTGTTRNCAGGPTPWGTWISCEEEARGTSWECDPTGAQAAVEILPFGSFRHEAAAVDFDRAQVYLTEDETDGRFYRFTSATAPTGGRVYFGAGTLEVMRVLSGSTGTVEWLPVPDPNPGALATGTRNQVPTSTAFDGGEGIFFFEQQVYFTTKGDNRVWVFDIANQTLDILYDAATSPTPVLTGVDNVHISPAGDVIVGEDGGDMQICVITPSGQVKVIVEITGQNASEITGPALDPSGTRLYFSSQRGTTGLSSGGITYEVSGPFFV